MELVLCGLSCQRRAVVSAGNAEGRFFGGPRTHGGTSERFSTHPELGALTPLRFDAGGIASQRVHSAVSH